jgi:hypothetical protein
MFSTARGVIGITAGIGEPAALEAGAGILHISAPSSRSMSRRVGFMPRNLDLAPLPAPRRQDEASFRSVSMKNQETKRTAH